MAQYSAENRAHFVAALRERTAPLLPLSRLRTSVCAVRSSKKEMSWFYYLFGVKPESEYVALIEMDSATVTLFHQEALPCADFQVRKREELPHFFKEVTNMLVVEGINSDTREEVSLTPDWKEFSSLTKAQHLAGDTVMLGMKSAKAGTLERSVSVCMDNYCKQTHQFEEYGFPTIVAAGKNIANLRHFSADSHIKASDLVLVDFSITLGGYVSDLTATFPVSGKFTTKQRQIYEVVYRANRSVIEASKPGVKWTDMHLLAEGIILEGLQRIGVVKKEADLKQIQSEGVGTLFFPNGVGHLVGLDIQDVGGYLEHTPKRSEEINLKQLRHARVLQAGMVTSVEPGCYFDLEKLETTAEIVDTECIDKALFKQCAEEVGGVRIEDVIVITESGCELLTPEDFPRSVEEIEKFMSDSQ